MLVFLFVNVTYDSVTTSKWCKITIMKNWIQDSFGKQTSLFVGHYIKIF